jgi:hypothetical protein
VEVKEILSILMLIEYSKNDWVFNNIGSECDWTPENIKRTKKGLTSWLKTEGYQPLGLYKYGEVYIKYKTSGD